VAAAQLDRKRFCTSISTDSIYIITLGLASSSPLSASSFAALDEERIARGLSKARAEGDPSLV
jgi:hypothetical protein